MLLRNLNVAVVDGAFHVSWIFELVGSGRFDEILGVLGAVVSTVMVEDIPAFERFPKSSMAKTLKV